MLSRLKNGFWRPFKKAFQDRHLLHFGVLLLRLGMILSVLALPFFLIIISADYFESLERSGPVGAIIADTMLSVMIVSYLFLLYMLKQRRI